MQYDGEVFAKEQYDKSSDSPNKNNVLKKIQDIELSILLEFDKICKSNDLIYWLDGGTLLGAVRHQGFIPWDDDIDVLMPRRDYIKFLSLAHSLPKDFYVEVASSSEIPSFSVPCKIRHKFSKIVEAYPDSMDDQGKGVFIDVIPVDSFRSSKHGLRLDVTVKSLYRALTKIHYHNSFSYFGFYFILNKVLNLLAPLGGSKIPAKLFYKTVSKHWINASLKRKESDFLGYGFDVYWTRIFKLHDVFPLQKIIFEGYEFNAPKNTSAILSMFYGKDYFKLPEVESRQPKHIRRVIVSNILGADNGKVTYKG